MSWAPKMLQYVETRLDVAEEVWDEHVLHTDALYDAYIRWWYLLVLILSSHMQLRIGGRKGATTCGDCCQHLPPTS
jgi:hypothetical protein